MKNIWKYEAVAATADSDEEPSQQGPPAGNNENFFDRRHQRFVILVLITTSILLLCSTLGLSYYVFETHRISGSARDCVQEMHNFSPIMNDIDLQYTTKRLDGRLLDVDHSIYIQDPSPKVDMAWEKLSKNDFVYVSSSDAQRMGKDPSVMAKLPTEWGYGEDAYAAELDIVHKIHCLDTLRKEMHFDHYYGYKYANRSSVSEGHRMHANHCLNILLQTLTCDANPDLVPFVWVKGQTHPFPDFSIQRKCGNLDALYQWKEQHAIERERYVDLRLAEGEKKLLLLPELRRIFGLDDE